MQSIKQKSYIQRCEKQKQSSEKLKQLQSSNIYSQIVRTLNPHYQQMQKQRKEKFNKGAKIQYDRIYLCVQNGIHYYPYQTEDLPLSLPTANEYMKIKQELQEQKIKVYELCIAMYQDALFELQQKKEQLERNQSIISNCQDSGIQRELRQAKQQCNRHVKTITDLQSSIKKLREEIASKNNVPLCEPNSNRDRRDLQFEISKMKSLSNNKDQQISILKNQNIKLKTDVSFLESKKIFLTEELQKSKKVKSKLQQKVLKYKDLLSEKTINYDLLVQDKDKIEKELTFFKNNLDSTNIVYLTQKPENVEKLEEHIDVLNSALIKKEDYIRNQKEVRSNLQETRRQENKSIILESDLSELGLIMRQLEETDLQLAAAVQQMKDMKVELDHWKNMYQEELKSKQCWEIDALLNQKAIDLEKEAKKQIEKLLEGVNVNKEVNNIHLRNAQKAKAKIAFLEKMNVEKANKLELFKKESNADLNFKNKQILDLQAALKAEKKDNQTKKALIRELQLKVYSLQAKVKNLQQNVNGFNHEKLKMIESNKKSINARETQFYNQKKQIIKGVFRQISAALQLGKSCDSVEELKQVTKANHSTVLTVSSILEAKIKERRFLINLIEKNTQLTIDKSQLVFNYDVHHRSFIPYLSEQKFPFVIIFKLQQSGNIIGVFTYGFDPDATKKKQTFLFSLKDNGISYGRDPESNVQTPAAINSNYLYFGNNELSIKNNGNNEFSLTLYIHGSKYFKLNDEYPLIGEENKSKVKFSQMEVHRLYLK